MGDNGDYGDSAAQIKSVCETIYDRVHHRITIKYDMLFDVNYKVI